MIHVSVCHADHKHSEKGFEHEPILFDPLAVAWARLIFGQAVDIEPVIPPVQFEHVIVARRYEYPRGAEKERVKAIHEVWVIEVGFFVGHDFAPGPGVPAEELLHVLYPLCQPYLGHAPHIYSLEPCNVQPFLESHNQLVALDLLHILSIIPQDHKILNKFDEVTVGESTIYLSLGPDLQPHIFVNGVDSCIFAYLIKQMLYVILFQQLGFYGVDVQLEPCFAIRVAVFIMIHELRFVIHMPVQVERKLERFIL